MDDKNVITNDRIFSLLIEMMHEKNFLEAKKRPLIHCMTEGHENGNAVGLFLVENSKNVLDFIHEDITFYSFDKIDLKKFLIDHSEPRRDGALIISDTKISDNVFFSGVVGQALKNVNMTKIDQLLKTLLPADFSHHDCSKIEVGSKTRTAMSVPVACSDGRSYLMKKSAYKNVEEGTGKVVRFGKMGLECEFYFSYDNFLPLPGEYFFDERNAIGVVKTYSYNVLTKKVENTGKYLVNAKMLGEGKGLYLMEYPAMQKMEYLASKLKN